jgi:hypothetical protein
VTRRSLEEASAVNSGIRGDFTVFVGLGKHAASETIFWYYKFIIENIEEFEM